jgi:hypothetical protein
MDLWFVLPIFGLQSRNPAEFPKVMRHKREIVSDRDGRYIQISLANSLATRC